MTIRIRRLSIRDVGPLASFELEPGELTLVHGGNEAGKTSCIDAILAGLRGLVRPGARRMLDAGERGRGDEGGVRLELEPADGGALVALLHEHPSLARLFVVRDGDAALESGHGWLEAIRGRLSGIDLARVADRVRVQGGLTPGGALRAARATERDRARERLGRIDAFLADLPAIDGLLDDHARAERGREDDRARVERLRAAARWDAHRLVLRAGELLRASAGRVRELAELRDEDLGAWREAVSSLREAAALSKNAEFNAAVLVEQAAADASRLRESEQAVGHLEDLREEVRRRGLPEMVERGRSGERSAHAWSRARGPCAAIATLLLAAGISLASRAAGIEDPAARLRLAMAAGAAGTGGLGAAALALVGTLRARRGAEQVRRAVEACGEVLLDVADLDACAAHLDAIDGEIADADAALAAAAARRDATRARLSGAREVASRQSAEVERAQAAVAAVRTRTGVASPDELESRLRERALAEASAAEARRTLASLAGGAAVATAAAVEPPAMPDPGIPADPSALAAAEARLRDLDDASLRLRETIAERRDRALASLGLADVSGLEAERERLDSQAERIEREERAARLCLEALGDLSLDLDGPLRESLGDGPDGAGATLARLTGGRWASVLPAEDGGLLVRGEDGSRLPASSLSRGARDQLALAVRLALVRRLLGEPAFLVLDDAFLTSDAARRSALATAVAQLSREGWQILFFTFDDAIRDAFAAEGARVVDLSRASRRTSTAP